MLTEEVGEVFGHATARIFPVPTGTAANALALSAMTPAWGAVRCHPDAHIITHEGGASSLFAGGAVMSAVPSQSVCATTLWGTAVAPTLTATCQ